jgi:phosphopantothenoylcysteine decarboxylase/phosphopantothenate--cysteine ligase
MRVILGVSGGVAVYKAAELVRRLQQERLAVQVVMTRHAQEFVTPLTFAALTGQKVITGMFGGEAPANLDSAVEHIGVAQSLDALVIAPATANTLAKMARGIADDFLTTLYLATTAPVIVAPAMNVNMWDHPATQENIEILRTRGVRIVSPDEGYLACGMTGKGRLAGVEPIAQAVLAALGIRHDLERDTVLITAGPTCEDIDPVRYVTNRSSGKMGYALAEAAIRRGARVILVSGPTALDAPDRVERISVRSTEEMHRAVLAHLSPATIVIMAAAVADYRPVTPRGDKIKRQSDRLTLDLEPTPDILADLSSMRGERIMVGFAAETGNVAENARRKLASKSADLIVANDVTVEGAGFDVDTNVVTFFPREGREISLPRMSKLDVAHRVFDQALELRRARQSPGVRPAALNPQD